MSHKINTVQFLGMVHASEFDNNSFKYDPPKKVRVDTQTELRLSYYLACLEEDYRQFQLQQQQ